MKTAFVKCNSHRSREKLTRLLGYYPQSYYNPAVSYHLYEIPEEKLETALSIKGITKGKFKSIELDGHMYAFGKTWGGK